MLTGKTNKTALSAHIISKVLSGSSSNIRGKIMIIQVDTEVAAHSLFFILMLKYFSKKRTCFKLRQFIKQYKNPCTCSGQN